MLTFARGSRISSYRQIARSLKMSESAVETLLPYRARLRFRRSSYRAEGEGELTHDRGRFPSWPRTSCGKLRRPQAEAVRMHIAVCAKCARKVEAAGSLMRRCSRK